MRTKALRPFKMLSIQLSSLQQRQRHNLQQARLIRLQVSQERRKTWQAKVLLAMVLRVLQISIWSWKRVKLTRSSRKTRMVKETKKSRNNITQTTSKKLKKSKKLLRWELMRMRRINWCGNDSSRSTIWTRKKCKTLTLNLNRCYARAIRRPRKELSTCRSRGEKLLFQSLRSSERCQKSDRYIFTKKLLMRWQAAVKWLYPLVE